MHPDDTIAALASAAGPGLRGMIRLSGPETHAILAAVVQGVDSFPPQICQSGQVRLTGFTAPVPVEVYPFFAPHSYTGQDMAELHTIGSPPVLEALLTCVLNAGARPARPGEFTLRSFLAGKRDLAQAEAVLGVIAADSVETLKHALVQLAGGLTRPLDSVRDDLLNLLADIEAGLDFVEEDIQFVSRDETLSQLAKAMAQLTLLQKQLDARTLSGQTFQVVLVGLPNAGKSSLFNALLADQRALVSEVPGTTRDYLVTKLALEDLAIELVDTAGHEPASDTIAAQAQALGADQTRRASLVLHCVPADQLEDTVKSPRVQVPVVRVATKSDRAAPPAGWFACSAWTGRGLDELRQELLRQARQANLAGLAPSQSRCRHHIDQCLDHLRKAHGIVLFEDPPELLALEVRLALDQLGEMVGAVYTDDLLDRIFSRFCIGK